MDESLPHPSQTVTRTRREELAALARLGGPIVLVQFGMTAMNLVDVAMLGRHAPDSLPAMALGNTLAWAAQMFGIGAVTAVDPLLAQAVGAGDHSAIPRLLGRGLLLAGLLAVPTMAVLVPAATWLHAFGQPAALVGEAATYARLQALGVVPWLGYSVLRSLLSARARLAPQVVTIAAGNALNLVLDRLLIFGAFGLPALGAAGAAWATVACRWLMLAGLLWFGRRELWPHLRALAAPAVRRAAAARGPLLRLLRLGAPIGGQFVLEMGVFATTAFLIGRLDAERGNDGIGPGLGGHQIALQLASLSFMVPLGVGIAASVRVGWAVGRRDLPAARRAAAAALQIGGTVMAGFMLAFLTLPHALAAALSEHPAVVAVGASLIPIAGVFQIGDGLQVVAIGCLRGLGDTRSPLLANAVGFWLIGLPLGAWLAFDCQRGPAGLWWGLVVGLFSVAVAVLLVLRLRLARLRERLAAD